jgi:ubiquitin carboxyl-terminal hydrolase 1
LGRVGHPRLDEGFPAAAPGRGWLRASDDAVREVGIETVLQEGSGAFMLYYERVRNEDKLSVPAWPSSHSRTPTGDDDDDVAREIDGGGGQEKAGTYHLQDVVKCELGEEVVEEVEETLVIKARVVRSVSLGRGDDFFEGASEVDPDSEEARLSRSPSPRPAKPEHTVAEAPPIPDDPPIGAVPQSADHRA